MAESRPFVIGDGDTPEESGADGVHDQGVAEGGDVALALQPRLLLVDAARHVDAEEKLQVHRQRTGGPPRQAEEQGQNQHPDCPWQAHLMSLPFSPL